VEIGDRRQATGDRRQATGDRRQEILAAQVNYLQAGESMALIEDFLATTNDQRLPPVACRLTTFIYLYNSKPSTL
jgi:hypothetical protein